MPSQTCRQHSIALPIAGAEALPFQLLKLVGENGVAVDRKGDMCHVHLQYGVEICLARSSPAAARPFQGDGNRVAAIISTSTSTTYL